MRYNVVIFFSSLILFSFSHGKTERIAEEVGVNNIASSCIESGGNSGKEQWIINKALNKVKEIPEGLQLKNPAYTVTFSSKGFVFSPTSGAPQLTWVNDQQQPVVPTSGDSKIIYRRGAITEQYIIKQNTFEQQFIIHEPLNLNDRTFVISGVIQTDGQFERTSTGWKWKNEFGEVLLGDVTVYDASKRKFPAMMKVTANGTLIELETKFYRDATYPLTIDPEFGTEDFRISNVGPNNEAVGYSGTNASVAYCPVITAEYPKGIYLVAYVGNYAGKNDIYGQRINGETGELIGSEIRICNMGPDNTSYAASAPDIAASNSEFFIVWHGDDLSLNNDKFEVYGQRVDAVSGATINPRIRISTTGPDNTSTYGAFNPAVAYNGTWNSGSITGSYMVVWYSDHVSNDQFEIFSQGVDTQGNLISTNQRVSNMGPDGNALHDALRPDVAWNSISNTYLVAWHGDHEAVGDGQNEVFVRRIDGSNVSHGTVLGVSEVRISDMGPAGNTNYGASDAAIAFNSTPANNNFLVVWHGDDDVLSVLDENEIFGQFVSNLGTIVSVNNFFRISFMGPDGQTAYSAQNASISHDPHFNRYFVVWFGDDNSSPLIDNEIEVFGQVLDATGGAVGARERISEVGGSGNTTYSASLPAVSYNTLNNEHLIVWHGDNPSGTSVDNELEIWGQRFAETSAEPTAQPTSPIISAITSTSSTVSYSTASGSPDGYIVLRKSGSSPTDAPVDQTVYTVGDIIGTSTVAYVGSALTFNQTGLTANTTYHYDFFSYNGVNSSLNYRTTTPLESSFTTLFAEPSTQGTLSFSSFGTNSITINLSAGNGTNRLLVVKAGSAVDVFPADAVSYTPNNNIGSAPNLGSSNFVVGNGTGNVTVSGLSTATVYHFRVFEFNGTSTLTNYNTASITSSTGSKSTLSASPSAQPTAINFTSVTNTSFTVGFTEAAGSPTGYIAIRKSDSAPTQPADLPVDGTIYTVNDIIGGSTVVHVGSAASFAQTSLTAATEYYYLLLSFNGSGPNINYREATPLAGNKFTLADEPGTQAQSITFNSLNTTSYTLSWNNGTGSERLVVARATSAVSFTPQDASTYTGDANFTTAIDQGSGNKVVYRGTDNSVALTNLTPGTVYHIRIFELNGSGQSSNYLTTSASGNPNSRTTLLNEPDTQTTGISFSTITSSSIQVNFTNGDGTSRLVVARQGEAVTTHPADGSSYVANTTFGIPESELGTGNFIVGSGTGPITVSGLAGNTTYHFRVYEFNGTSETENYNVSTATDNPASITTLPGEPTTQASAVTFTTFTDNSISISWTNGNGSERLVLVREGSEVNTNPIDGIAYTGDANFTTATDLGSGNKVVFRGSGNSFTLTNLTANTPYYVRVFELDGSGSLSNYNTSTATGNPNVRTTLQTQPVSQPSALLFSQHSTTGVRLNFTAANGSPTGYLIIRKTGSPSAGIPLDGTAYAVGETLDGTIVAITNATQFDDSGLSSGTTYHYTLFSFNGSNDATNYLTSSPLTNVTITLPDAPSAQAATSIGQTSFTANWTSIAGASNYRIDVSADNFTTFVTGYNSKSVSALFETIVGLTPGTNYKFRVRAENSIALQSANSNEVAVTTALPSGAGLQIALNPVESQGVNKIVSVTLTGGVGTPLVKFFSHKILENAFDEVTLTPVTGTTYQVTVTPLMLDVLGIEYYFTASDGATTVTTQNPGNQYFYTVHAQSELTLQGLSSGGQLENYRIISIPYVVEDNLVQSIFGILGEYDKTKWRLIHYQNNKNVDFPGFNRIELGQGYWFNSVQPATINLGASTAPPFNQQKPFQLVLAAGWNQIGDPYPFDISWEDVLRANVGKPVGNLKTFAPAAGAFEESDDLKKWSGGFVFADEPTTLTFPVTIGLSGRKANREGLTANIDAHEWMLPLTLVHGKGQNNMIGFGMHPDASVSKDLFDDITAPRFWNYLEMATTHNDFFAPSFTRDVVPTTELYTWHFTMQSTYAGETASLQWDNTTLGVREAQLILHDVTTQTFVNMKSTNEYLFAYSGRAHEFRILFSSDEVVNPGFTGLGKPYPNPSANVIFLPLAIETEADYRVSVLSSQGQELTVISAGVLPKGVHTLRWNEAAQYGPGMYIIQLQSAGRLRQIQKVLIR